MRRGDVRRRASVAARAVAEQRRRRRARTAARKRVVARTRSAPNTAREIEEAVGDRRRVAARVARRSPRTSPPADPRRRSRALLVGAARVADPAGDRQREMRDRRRRREPVAHRAEQALRQLLRAVHRDLPRPVRQRRIAEALRSAARSSAARSMPGGARERRRDLLGHLPLDAASRAAGRRDACQMNSWPAGSRGTRASNGCRSAGAASSSRTARRRRRTARRRPPTAGARRRSGPRSPTGRTARPRPARRRARRAAASASAMSASVVAGTMRSTIVHGNATFAPIQSASAGSRALRERVDDALDHAPVVRQVVAADDGERPGAGRAPRGEARDEDADRATPARRGCARSCAMSGCARLSAPVAGSWQ